MKKILLSLFFGYTASHNSTKQDEPVTITDMFKIKPLGI
jgi:hypothetical protein